MVRVAEKSDETKKRLKIIIHGVVQGVGFRPFVYRLASEMKLNGWVSNTAQGLIIEAEGEQDILHSFIAKLQSEKPKHSFIQSIETLYLDPIGFTDFTIKESDSTGEPTTLILPDIAVCDECLNEMSDPGNRRYQYPFINCTHCGPRYSIIKSLPYDRQNTTMKIFEMCPDCEKEYNDPNDRRFHAQPIACPKCGPHIELWKNDGTVGAANYTALQQAVIALKIGKIVALKGLGGFQLLVDAGNDEAVNRLRIRKHREEKPFAVMFPSLKSIEAECFVSETEKRLLISSESPIVILRKKTDSHTERSSAGTSRSVSPNNPYLGVMLPYTPLHHLVMQELNIPIVATSGNISDEPMCIDEQDALQKLGSIADLFLVHNRPIHRYVDDSIVRVVMDREMVIRRARGYAPLPIITKEFTEEPLLAVGAHLKNTIALQKENMIFVSQHIGDLETIPALNCFKQTIDDIAKLYNVHPTTILHDLHPNYVSTSSAREMHGEKESFQHHFVHIASCMADNELNEPLLGIAWDGTGYGTDGTIWGGEFIDYDGENFSRIGSFKQFRLPGGDAAVKESVRSAIGMLSEMVGDKLFDCEPIKNSLSDQEKRLIIQMMEKNINSPLTSSVGRMFDAVGALLHLQQRANYEGQTAMQVEFAAQQSNEKLIYHYSIISSDDVPYVVDWTDMITLILEDIRDNISVNDIAKRFHNTLVEIIVDIALRSKRKKVVLSGGCFQNTILLESAIDQLRNHGFAPYWHQRIPTNDGGISVGQIYMHQLLKRKNRTVAISEIEA
jgi:hydrogenase maturation protein HypF